MSCWRCWARMPGHPASSPQAPPSFALLAAELSRVHKSCCLFRSRVDTEYLTHLVARRCLVIQGTELEIRRRAKPRPLAQGSIVFTAQDAMDLGQVEPIEQAIGEQGRQYLGSSRGIDSSKPPLLQGLDQGSALHTSACPGV